MTASWWRVRTRVLWYIVWATMLFVGCANLFFVHAWFASGQAFIFHLFDATIAACLLLLGKIRLPQRAAALAAIALVSFAIGEGVVWLRGVGPPSVNQGIDYGAYYVAARVISEGEAVSPYHVDRLPDGHMRFVAPAPPASEWQHIASHRGVFTSMPFIYPPFFAVLLQPLARLPFETSYAVWRGLELLFLAAAVWLTAGAGEHRLHQDEWLYLAVILCTFAPFADEILIGQVGSFVLLLVSVGVWMLKRQKDIPSAIAFAAAALVKVTPLMVVPVMLLHRRWRWLGVYTVALAAMLSFSVWQAGWKSHREFATSILPAISCGAPDRDNMSLFASIEQISLGYMPDSLASTIMVSKTGCNLAKIIALGLALLLLVRVALHHSPENTGEHAVMMMLATLPLSPISWRHQYTLALLPLLYLWGRVQDRTDRMLVYGLFAAVSTNILGLLVALTDQHRFAILLGTIVPGIALVLAYRRLRPLKTQHAA